MPKRCLDMDEKELMNGIGKDRPLDGTWMHGKQEGIGK